MVTVARRLAARGHAVTLLSDEANRSDAEGLDFRTWTRAPNRPDKSPASDPSASGSRTTPRACFSACWTA
jgi:hypothetical protein